jgi:hypothetical protein
MWPRPAKRYAKIALDGGVAAHDPGADVSAAVLTVPRQADGEASGPGGISCFALQKRAGARLRGSSRHDAASLPDEANPMKRFLLLLCTASTVGVATLLPACGSLESNTNTAPTLATLQGNLLDPSDGGVSSASDVRVAVIWRVNGAEREFNVAEDVPVSPMFPAGFSVALNAPPPAGAMNAEYKGVPVIYCIPDSGIPESPECAQAAMSVAAGGQAGGAPGEGGAAEPPSSPPPPTTPPENVSPGSEYAIGTLVAYVDQNHNGKLDLVGANATSYVDQILATNADLAIVYIEGPVVGFSFAPLEDAQGHKPVDGYNLVSIPQCNGASLYGPPCATSPAPGDCGSPQWLAVGSPYPLTVASSPEVSRLMCAEVAPSLGETSGTAGPYDPAVQPAQYPAPDDPAVCCASDGSDYLYSTCTAVPQGLCRGVVESCTSMGYGRPTPTPAGWPCAE